MVCLALVFSKAGTSADLLGEEVPPATGDGSELDLAGQQHKGEGISEVEDMLSRRLQISLLATATPTVTNKVSDDEQAVH